MGFEKAGLFFNASACQGKGADAFQVITSASMATCPKARLTETR
jgi:hypothetical protein